MREKKNLFPHSPASINIYHWCALVHDTNIKPNQKREKKYFLNIFFHHLFVCLRINVFMSVWMKAGHWYHRHSTFFYCYYFCELQFSFFPIFSCLHLNEQSVRKKNWAIKYITRLTLTALVVRLDCLYALCEKGVKYLSWL